jgi:hypothetical protein
MTYDKNNVMNQSQERLIKIITALIATSFIALGFIVGPINSLIINSSIILLGIGIKLFNMYRFDPTTRKKKKREGGLSGLLC